MTDLYEHLAVTQDDGVLSVRIDRPRQRNALSRAVLTEIGRAFETNRENREIRVAILTGAGDKAFAAGGDLKDFASIRTEEEADGLFRLANQALDAIRRFPVPTIAALNGTAVGGGAELAVACDFRVAARHATIGYVQARLAITSGFGGGADLMALLGTRRALLHMLRGEALSAEAARTLGLVDEVTEARESLDDCVSRFIDPFREHPGQVLRALKALAIAGESSAGEREALERKGFARTWAHPDHWAALERVLSSKR